MGLSLSQASLDSSEALMPDLEAWSLAYPALAESILLSPSCSVGLDEMGVEVDVVSEPTSSLAPMYEKLLEIMTCTYIMTTRNKPFLACLSMPSSSSYANLGDERTRFTKLNY